MNSKENYKKENGSEIRAPASSDARFSDYLSNLQLPVEMARKTVFYRVMYGRKQKASRWKDCTTKTTYMMKYAAGAMYVRKAFDQASKRATQNMIGDLQEAFRGMLRANDWMDTKTKALALDKVNQMLRHIAYPDFILDNEKLDDYYSGFTVQESDFYSDMVEKLLRWKLEYKFKRLIKPVDRNEYEFNPAEVNAYYEPSFNSINFPAAILQPPFFHHTFPRFVEVYGKTLPGQKMY
ncbi:hypothetical protein ANCDUO_01907 [Ancylostoma duodenale]|uniref:Peptidase M13 N-terminal domain-containing protein n=1 Tax=Ancylostoma duodenale TaxID=51022 RepID=A0A0C2H856_9BILA|nr:hypothetical protein ANCDUO_01907 [Ancylostoma duodenale]